MEKYKCLGEIERKEQGTQSDSIELHAFDLIPNFQANLFYTPSDRVM